MQLVNASGLADTMARVKANCEMGPGSYRYCKSGCTFSGARYGHDNNEIIKTAIDVAVQQQRKKRKSNSSGLQKEAQQQPARAGSSRRLQQQAPQPPSDIQQDSDLDEAKEKGATYFKGRYSAR
jgi:hypothetical protein